MTKEQIYDDQINPLMAQILAICKEHKIAMIASFATPNAEDPDLRCTSAMLGGDDFDAPNVFYRALDLVYPPVHVIAMTVTTKP